MQHFSHQLSPFPAGSIWNRSLNHKKLPPNATKLFFPSPHMGDLWVIRGWFSLKLSCSRHWAFFVLGQVTAEGRTFGKTWGEKGSARTSNHNISRHSLVFYHKTQSKQPTCSSFSFRSCCSNSISASALARAWEARAASAQNSWASSSSWNWDFSFQL